MLMFAFMTISRCCPVMLLALLLVLWVEPVHGQMAPDTNASSSNSPSTTGATTLTPPSASTVEEPRTQYKSYAKPMLVADGAFGLLSLAVPELIIIGPLPGPVLHLGHGQPGRAVGSLLLRLGAGLGGFLVGYESARSSPCACEDPGLRGSLIGASVGSMVGGVIDALLLARKPIKPGRKQEKIGAIPQVRVTPEQVHIGVSGYF